MSTKIKICGGLGYLLMIPLFSILTACNSGTNLPVNSDSNLSASQELSFNAIEQYATPNSCILVTGQTLNSASEFPYYIGGSVNIKNVCTSKQAINDIKIIMSSDKVNLNGSFSLYDLLASNSLVVPMGDWEQNWAAVTVTTTQFKDPVTSLQGLVINFHPNSGYEAAYLKPDGSTSFTFGYTPNPQGVMQGNILFSSKDTIPSSPGIINLTLDTKPLVNLCKTMPCKIPLYLIGQNGNFNQLITTIDNASVGKQSTLKLKNLLAGNYSFQVNSNDLPKTVQLITNPSFNLASGETVNESIGFKLVKITTGSIKYSIDKPSTFNSDVSTLAVQLTKTDGSYTYTSLNNFAPDTFNNVEKGNYSLITNYGLADALLGKYANPLQKSAIKVSAESATELGNLAFTTKNANASVTFNVTGLELGDVAELKITDNLAGRSYLYNKINVATGINKFKLLESDNLVLNFTTSNKYKPMTALNYIVVKNGRVDLNFVKAESSPILPSGTVALNNKSSYFLHLQNNSPNQSCPTLIKPGQQTSVAINKDSPWANACYYLVCSSKDYQSGAGCVEATPDGGMNQGGYIAWVNLNPDTKTCGLPGYDLGTNSFACEIDKTGNVIINFKSKQQTYSAGPNVNQVVKLAQVAKNYIVAPGLKYRGINISGYEYNGTIGDAMYQRPDLPDIKYFVEQGMNTIRLPIRWEYIFADNKDGYDNQISSSSLDLSKTHINKMYLDGLKDTVTKYLANGVNVILDMHTYLRYCKAGNDESIQIGQKNEPTDPVVNQCKIVTATEFANVWGTLAKELKPLALQYNISQPNQLMFSLVNEPFSQHDQILKTQEVFNIEVAGALAIRNLGLTNRIIFSGNYWDPLHGWTNFVPSDGSASLNDQANGNIFTKANFVAAGLDVNTLALEVHQYFDRDYSGRSEICSNYSNYEDFVQKLDLTSMGKWMNDNHMQVMLSEFGGADNPTCKQDLDYMLQYLEKHALGQSGQSDGGFIGWQLWRGNRHNNGGYGAFSYLDKGDYTVYGGNGSKPATPDGTGINQGLANGLMDALYANHLIYKKE